MHVPCIYREQAPLPHKALAMLLGHTLRSRDRGGVRCVAHMLDPNTRADPTSAENARFERLFAENARAASPGGRGSLPPPTRSVAVPAMGAGAVPSVMLYRVEAVGEAAGGGGLPRLRVFSARCATKQLSSEARPPTAPSSLLHFTCHPPRPPSLDTPPPRPPPPPHPAERRP